MAWRAAVGTLGALILAATPALAQNVATIPLHKRPDPSGFANFIAVSVGGGLAGDVLLDTGSTGLRMRAAAVGPDVRLTNNSVTYSYTSGNVLKGVVGYAKVSFPGAKPAVATKAEIAIHVVQQITCKAGKPDCPGWKPTEMGVMGVAYLPFAVFNPLAQLEGNLAGGFVVAADDIARPTIVPHIVVGLTTRTRPGFRSRRSSLRAAAINPRSSRPGTPKVCRPVFRSTTGRSAASAPCSTPAPRPAASSRPACRRSFCTRTFGPAASSRPACRSPA
jgi:hypothetical protein